MKSATYYQGYDAKAQEIREMGFAAARDKLNSEYPPGQPWTGSSQGLEYTRGNSPPW